jgi:hypothetical protein
VKVTLKELLDEAERVFGGTPRSYCKCPLPCIWETLSGNQWECFLRVSRSLVLKGEATSRIAARRSLHAELKRLAPVPRALPATPSSDPSSHSPA